MVKKLKDFKLGKRKWVMNVTNHFIKLKDGSTWNFIKCRNLNINTHQDLILVMGEFQESKFKRFYNASFHLRAIEETNVEIINKFLEEVKEYDIKVQSQEKEREADRIYT